jgi:hypothetical protein
MEASIKDQEEGGFGNHRGGSCLGFGMPIIAYGFEPQEFIVTPDTTYILVNWVEHTRRIFTDGRDWPSISNRRSPAIPSGAGSTRIRMAATMCLKSKPVALSMAPATMTATGLPLHRDNQSIFKERIYLDKADKDIIHNEITVIDHALTRPWTITRDYRRNPTSRPNWSEFICAENKSLCNHRK